MRRKKNWNHIVGNFESCFEEFECNLVDSIEGLSATKQNFSVFDPADVGEGWLK